jgi:DNA-binding MarR family transcriptional regulator
MVEVVDGLMATARLLVSLTARSLGNEETNVTLPQLRTLVILASSGPRRVIDLAADLGVQPSTATRMCDRLVRKGFVARQERPDDRRVAWMALDRAGRGLVATIMEHRRRYLAELVASVELPDPEGFAAALESLATAAGELPEPQWQERWLLQSSAR